MTTGEAKLPGVANGASKRPRSLGFHLVAMSAALVLPALAISAYLAASLVRSEMTSGRDRLSRAALAVSGDIDRDVAGLITVAEALAVSESLERGDLAAFHGRASRGLAGRDATVLLLDGSYQQLVNTRVPYGTPLPKATDTESASNVIQTGKPTNSDVFTGAVSRQRLVNVAVPVRAGPFSEPRADNRSTTEQPVDGARKASYVLVVSVNAARFEPLLRDAVASGPARIADRKGASIGGIGDDILFDGAVPAPGLGEVRAADGSISLVATHRSALTGWSVSVAAPKALIDAALWKTVNGLVVAGLIAFTMATGFCMYLSRQMAAAMAQLRQATLRLARGDPVTPAALPVAEANVAMDGIVRARALVEARTQALAASEARYREALQVGRMASWEGDLATRTRHWSPEAVALMGVQLDGYDGVIGGPDDELRNAIHPDDRHRLDAYHRAFQAVDEIEAAYRIVQPGGRIRHFAGRGRVVARTRDGAPARVANVMVDITEQALAAERIAEQARLIEAEKARYQALVQVSSQVEWTADADGMTSEDSPSWRAFTGQTFEQWVGRGWLDAVHPDDRTRTAAVWATAIAGSGEYQVDYRLRHVDGSWRWTSARGVALRDSAGRVTKWVGMNEDISERKRREEHLDIVMRELSHRTKNLLAVIQSIARRSFADGKMAGAFNERLQGLSVSHDLLVDGHWRGASLDDLVRAHLAPFLAGAERAVSIAGPRVSLKPELAQSMGLALHELATNAAKYGALSEVGGAIEVSWSIASADRALRLTWRERVGRAIPQHKRSGFGQMLLERIVASSVGGRSGYELGENDVVWWLEIPGDNYVV